MGYGIGYGTWMLCVVKGLEISVGKLGPENLVSSRRRFITPVCGRGCHAYLGKLGLMSFCGRQLDVF